MKIILLENIKKLGKVNQTIEVKDGYAWNYLIPQKKAIPATIVNQEQIKHKIEEITKKVKDKEIKIKLWTEQLNNHNFIFYLKQKKDSQECFGSVTNKQILREINLFLKTKLSSNIFLKDMHLKTIGNHKVSIKLVANKPLDINILIKAITK